MVKVIIKPMNFVPKFEMLVGPPGSGKSTYCKDKKGFIIISSDDIFEEMAAKKGLTYSEAFKKLDYTHAVKKMKQRLNIAVLAKKDIIWDQTNMTAKSRADKLKKIPDTYHKTAVNFIIDTPTLKQRLKHRGETTGKIIPAYVFARMCNSYVAPSKDEGFDKIVTIRS